MSVTRAELSGAKGGKLFKRRMLADLPHNAWQSLRAEHGWARQILRIDKVKITLIRIEVRAVKHKRQPAQERIINNGGIIRHHQGGHR